MWHGPRTISGKAAVTGEAEQVACDVVVGLVFALLLDRAGGAWRCCVRVRDIWARLRWAAVVIDCCCFEHADGVG